MILSEREVQRLGLWVWSQYQAGSPEFLQSCHALNCSCIEAKTFCLCTEITEMFFKFFMPLETTQMQLKRFQQLYAIEGSSKSTSKWNRFRQGLNWITFTFWASKFWSTRTFVFFSPCGNFLSCFHKSDVSSYLWCAACCHIVETDQGEEHF